MNDAIQVDFLLAGLTDTNGNALNAGKVYTYDAGTSNNRTTWTESDKSVAAANPVILDAYGRALIFADGNYKMVVKDADDVILYTWDNLEYGNQGIILPEVSAPSGIAGKIQLTAMADAGDTEFRVTDGAGNAVQMTKDGVINAMAKLGSSTDNQVTRWNGATGGVLQGSTVVIDDSGNITGVVGLTTTGALEIAGAITGVTAITASTDIACRDINVNRNVAITTKLTVAGTVVAFDNIPSGATQGAAGVAAGELWVTSGHATQEDNTVMRGV